MEKPIIENRTYHFNFEKREGGDTPIIKGHAAVFDEKISSPFFGFDEMVARNAFTDTIKQDDVRALFNHDANFVLGRNTSKTLRLSEDNKGLAIEIDPPDTQQARDLMQLLKRGDISQMSFAFQIEKESWEKGEEGKPDLRILERVKLFDVSVVTYPAYEGTDAGLRSYNQWLSETKKYQSSQNWTYKINLLKRRLNLIQRKGGKINE